MEIRPVGAELFQEDGQTDMTKLTVAFRNSAKAPIKTEDARRSSAQDVESSWNVMAHGDAR
jgi:hypothetical protein